MWSCEFEAALWEWDAAPEGSSWVFLTVPEDVSEEIRMQAGEPRGFGSVRVEVGVGATTWRTSVFPDSARGCYVLPVKKAVRKAQGIEPGDTAHVTVELRDFR